MHIPWPTITYLALVKTWGPPEVPVEQHIGHQRDSRALLKVQAQQGVPHMTISTPLHSPRPRSTSRPLSSCVADARAVRGFALDDQHPVHTPRPRSRRWPLSSCVTDARAMQGSALDDQHPVHTPRPRSRRRPGSSCATDARAVRRRKSSARQCTGRSAPGPHLRKTTSEKPLSTCVTGTRAVQGTAQDDQNAHSDLWTTNLKSALDKVCHGRKRNAGHRVGLPHFLNTTSEPLSNQMCFSTHSVHSKGFRVLGGAEQDGNRLLRPPKHLAGPFNDGRKCKYKCRMGQIA